ncbi:MAG: hypothetical protein HYU78_11450 [Rhodocyclales bacterium]|nr:hypothetical protein [Rhodocyclales bacterium]
MFGLFKKKFDIEAFIAGSVEGLKMTTDAHRGTWHFGEEKSWDVDQDNGHIIFTFANGTVASSPVQIVGTYNSKDSTFMWGWNHPSVVPALQAAASRVKAFGEEHNSNELTTQKVSCSEQRAWEYTALAMRLSESCGAYRGEAGPGTFVFMIFGEVRLAKET